jgi:beta-galactosidase
MRTETKGITQLVAVDGRPLSNWEVYTLPMDQLPTGYLTESPLAQAAYDAKSERVMASYAAQRSGNFSAAPCGFAYGTACPAYVATALTNGPPDLSSVDAEMAANPPTLAPHFFRAHFTLTATGDTFLDTSKLGKGAVWINGHTLGRFWSACPQRTLYVPGPWLHKGSNEIVVFDMLPQVHESVEGLDHPILDGPVSDKTTSNQE